LIEASERVCELKSRKSPALAIVRVLRNEAQVSVNASGKGGTRTLDPGIMRSDDAKKGEQLQQVAWCAVQLSAVCGPMFSTGCP
jgi:hypothetical protein